MQGSVQWSTFQGTYKAFRLAYIPTRVRERAIPTPLQLRNFQTRWFTFRVLLLWPGLPWNYPTGEMFTREEWVFDLRERDPEFPIIFCQRLSIFNNRKFHKREERAWWRAPSRYDLTAYARSPSDYKIKSASFRFVYTLAHSTYNFSTGDRETF